MELRTDMNENGNVSVSMTNKIDKWTPLQRDLLIKMVQRGKSFEEIGVELKRSPSSCRSMYSYAKLKLRIAKLEEALTMEVQKNSVLQGTITELRKEA